jgi:hypothetical protein
MGNSEQTPTVGTDVYGFDARGGAHVLLVVATRQEPR